MDVTEAIETRLEIREYADDPVEFGTKKAILEAGRLAPSGKNVQHWRFILIEDEGDLEALADISRTGSWVADADFAVVIVTDPEYYYHELDAGRATTYMQFEAWKRGVGSCIYTGYDRDEMRAFLDIPDDYAVPVVVGFGRPTFDVDGVTGRKDREPLSDIGYEGRFGEPLTRFES